LSWYPPRGLVIFSDLVYYIAREFPERVEIMDIEKLDELEEEEIYYHDHGDGMIHAHYHEHGTDLEHEHEHQHEGMEHSHGHTHTQTKAVVNRLSRAIGHLESVKRMVESGRDCTEVLVQLAAVRSALNSTAKVILKDHLEHCIVDANNGDSDQLTALNEAIDKFMS
jgi:DNA-binding FrmR family transcriptional regulator